jgi:hypothetical protein
LSGRAKQRSGRGGVRRLKALEARVSLARKLAMSPTTTVTLRVPIALNEWLDAYVHGAWPERVRKQELVTEALQLLIARRGGPGQERFATDLLEGSSTTGHPPD